MIRTVMLVAAGSAIGGALRYLAGLAVHSLLARTLPWGTFLVNVLGSLLIGVLFIVLASRGEAGEEIRAFWIIGLLGGFTTFSSFSMETLLLIEQGGELRAATYVAASVGMCLLAAWAGMHWARQWWN